MNKHIEELAKKAALDPALAEYYNVFAELIIRDCASICELNGSSYTHSFTPAKARLAETTSSHCSYLIRKHFGIN